MRIDAYNQISQLYQASKPKKITKKSEATVKEQYTVSSKGQDYRRRKPLQQHRISARKRLQH